MIRHTHSSRWAVKANQPWKLIGSSSCQVPLGNRLKLQSDYYFFYSGCQSIFGNTPIHDNSVSHERIKVSCESKLLFFPFSGTGWKTRPQRTKRPDGRPSRCSPAQHVSSALMIYSVQISLPLFDLAVRNNQLDKISPVKGTTNLYSFHFFFY